MEISLKCSSLCFTQDLGRRRDGWVSRFPCLQFLPIASSNAHHPPSNGEPSSGDPVLQQKLVEIFRLQAGKIRVSDFVDERSKHLTDIAQQAILEYDRIAQDAKKGIDKAGDKAMQSVDKDMQAFEDQLASARADIVARDEALNEFEKKLEIARSEGLFFKELYKTSKPWKDRDPVEQKILKDQVKNITKVTKKALASKSRSYLYVLFLLLLTFFLLEGFRSAEISFPRLAVFAAVIVSLILQLAYERFVASEKDDA